MGPLGTAAEAVDMFLGALEERGLGVELAQRLTVAATPVIVAEVLRKGIVHVGSNTDHATV